MSGQYGLSDEAQKKILKILQDENIQIEPRYREFNEETERYEPVHCEVSIHISSYDDEDEEYNMYVQVD